MTKPISSETFLTRNLVSDLWWGTGEFSHLGEDCRLLVICDHYQGVRSKISELQEQVAKQQSVGYQVGQKAQGQVTNDGLWRDGVFGFIQPISGIVTWDPEKVRARPGDRELAERLAGGETLEAICEGFGLSTEISE